MNRIILACLVSLFSSSIILAKTPHFHLNQKYFRFAFSYSNAANKTLFLFDPLSENSSTIFPQLKIGSSISGIAGFGTQIHKNIALETNLVYAHGLTLDYQMKPKSSLSYSLQNTSILLQPTTVFSASIGKWTPYIKVGLVVPLSYRTDFHIKESVGNQVQNYSHFKIQSELNIGLNGCVGISYRLNSSLSIFAEIEESNTRTFYRKAVLHENSGRLSSAFLSQLLDEYTSSNSTISQFPITMTRESYTVGLRINLTH